MAENKEKTYWSKVNILSKCEKDDPLDKAHFAVTGEITYARKKNGQYGDYLEITMTSVLGDKFVEQNFGKEFVNQDHEVQFRFNLSGYQMDNLLKFPPRWGQDFLVVLRNMKTVEFQRRNGETGRNVSAICSGFASLGSTKKADGTDRPPITVYGDDGQPLQEITGRNPAAPETRPLNTSVDLDELDEDEEMPF